MVRKELQLPPDFVLVQPNRQLIKEGHLEDVRLARAAFDAGANLCGVIIGRALYEGHIDLAEAVRIAEGQG